MGENRKERDANAVARGDAPDQQPTEEVDVAPSKSTKAPAFQFYPAEFLASHKVSRMPNVERGAYITLLCRCWLDNGLPTDLVELADLANMKPEPFQRMWKSGRIGKCFQERGGKFHNERLDVERKKQAEYRRRQTENGNKGGRPTKSGGEAGNNPPVYDSKPLISSSLDSSDLSLSRLTVPPPQQTPIHTSHKKHVLCGRVCLHAEQFGEFVRRRNHDGAHAEVLHFAQGVIDEWTTGAHAKHEPGDGFDFWRARYAERWPAERQAQGNPNEPEWARKWREAKAVAK